MPLTADQEQLEHELRVEQMTTTIDTGRINIEKMREDMRAAAARAALDTRWDAWKFGISFSVLAAACAGAGAALAYYVNSRQPPPALPAPPIVIYLMPGQAPAPSR